MSANSRDVLMCFLRSPNSTSVSFFAVSTAVLFRRHPTQDSNFRPPSVDLYSASKQTVSSVNVPSEHVDAQPELGTYWKAYDSRKKARMANKKRSPAAAVRPRRGAISALSMSTTATYETTRKLQTGRLAASCIF